MVAPPDACVRVCSSVCVCVWLCVCVCVCVGIGIGMVSSHNYTIVWHTGSNTTQGRTEFYIDGVYLGTNNAFAPTRGSRLYIAHWGPTSKNPLWNGTPDNWQGGTAGDGKQYNMTSYISEVNIIPFNEPNDIMCVDLCGCGWVHHVWLITSCNCCRYPDLLDQPTGCTPNYLSKYASSPSVCHPVWTAYNITPPAE